MSVGHGYSSSLGGWMWARVTSHSCSVEYEAMSLV